MIHYLQRIQKFLKNHKLALIEKKRIEDDLALFWERLAKRKYRIAYSAMNQFDIPERTREFHEHLKFYSLLGKIWATLLKRMDIKKFPRVVDLCPGYAPKIELALFYLDYRGEVVLLDKEISSMRQLEQFLEIFNPQFTTVKKRMDLFRRAVKQKYEVVLGNHIIDDLVLSYFCRKWRIPWKELYGHEGKLSETWRRILQKEHKHRNEILPKIAGILNGLTKKGSLIIISQYESYIEKILDLKGVSKFNADLITQLVAHLASRRFQSRKVTVKKVKKAFNFYILQRR